MTQFDQEVSVSPEEGEPLGLEPYLIVALDVIGIFLTGAVFLTAGAGVGGPVGILCALAFVTFVPGWAILDWLPLGYGVSRLGLAVGFSLTLCTASAQILLWAGLWQPLGLLYALGSLSLLGMLSHLVLAQQYLPRWEER